MQLLKNKVQDLEGENEDLIDEIEATKKIISNLNDKIKIINKEKLLIANHINNLKKENERIKQEFQLHEELMFEIETDMKESMDDA